MLVPHRTFSSPAYRYGFQGQEKDDEIKGNGNSLNYKFRMHDPRVGRFFAVDPLTAKYPHYTPYSFSGNKVIAFIELEGLEEAKFERQQANRDAPKLGITSDEFLKQTNGLRKPIRNLVIDAFKLPWKSGGTAEALVEHYGHGKGEVFTLNTSQMIEVYPTYTGNNGEVEKVDLSLTKLEFLSVGDMSVGETKPFKKVVPVYAGVSGTLGNFSATVSGIISIDPKTKLREFEGTVLFKDTYDFNKAKHRPSSAEGQVTIARNLLPGQGFKVVGELKVNQIYGQEINATLDNGERHYPARIKKPAPGELYNDEGQEAGEGGN